jgi:hypothetical protein
MSIRWGQRSSAKAFNDGADIRPKINKTYQKLHPGWVGSGRRLLDRHDRLGTLRFPPKRSQKNVFRDRISNP